METLENPPMRRGDLADLTAFVAVAELLNFRAASERLDVTASALSHTIKQLEARLGVTCCNAPPAASP
jgi:DNA-binding transcriptional LysR family regulator